MLEAGTYAANDGNMQTWRFPVVQGREVKQPPAPRFIRPFRTAVLDRQNRCDQAGAEATLPAAWAISLAIWEISHQEVARHLHRVKFVAGSHINDERGTVEFRTKVAGMMAKHAARIACERAGGKGCRA